MKIGFFFMIIFLAFRSDFGNDLQTYKEWFYEWRDIDLFQAILLDQKNESGYVILNKFVGFFGGFNLLLLVLGVFVCVGFYRFILRYGTKNNLWLSVLIYLIFTELFLIESTAIRQSIATVFMLFSLKFIIQRRLVPFVLITFLATFFHKSAYMLFLLYFIPLLRFTNPASLRITYIILFFLSLVVPELIINYFDTSLDDFSVIGLTYSETYLKKATTGIGFGTIFLTIIFGYILLSDLIRHPKYSLFFHMAIIYFFIQNLSNVMPMISRFNLYLAPAFIIVVPKLFSDYKTANTKLLFISIVLFYYSFSFVSFFNNPLWKSFQEYNTSFDFFT